MSEKEPNKIKADKELWPEAMKASHDFHNPLYDYYYDIQYVCRKCKKTAIWSAEQQKYESEVLKKSYYGKVLCELCYKAYNLLKARIREYERLWLRETESSKSQAEYIASWLADIQEFKKYTDKYNQSMEHKLRRLLDANQ
ncbi:hypothetical protein HCH_04378 [Hahella chejuensis KCTC 2396]|uniref:Uncharacterized protein n=1 Tax=Hahella chejuensis (strain KCTC 2396) TaxID=349521 RepID=Q2SE41_HAHCH|nr:hypothetical protein [Hahella chejuensis]ABC31083.1 hypothetical protein HCH_04378 [Hahella chejuensis KCTC 2396]